MLTPLPARRRAECVECWAVPARLRARAALAALPPPFDASLAERLQQLIERRPTLWLFIILALRERCEFGARSRTISHCTEVFVRSEVAMTEES